MTTISKQSNIQPPAENSPRDKSVALAQICLIIGTAVFVAGYLLVSLLTGSSYDDAIRQFSVPALYTKVGLVALVVVAIILWLASLVFSLRVIRRLYREQAFADIARARTIIIISSLLLLFVTASSITVYVVYDLHIGEYGGSSWFFFS